MTKPLSIYVIRRTGKVPRASASLAERLFAKLVKIEATGCLEFQGFCDKKGYGRIAKGGDSEGFKPREVVLAHRAAWELKHGPIPEGMNVLHKCDNPPCCNDDHLFLGTTADNNADMISKGRANMDYLNGGSKYEGRKLCRR